MSVPTRGNALPERIGKYEIRKELGRGGFGQVFLGFDPTVGRLVAVKVLAPGGDPSNLRRFRHEASAAGNLHHKNIVTIHEFGEDKGVFYIAMEYLEGRDLQHVISGGNKLSLLEKIRIMSEAAEGLQCAHQNGIVHRDVKPANIMVLDDGSVKLMDFGIARLTRSHSTRLTETGFLIGSIFYMAPEQLKAQEVDARCDIWAFGTIYYELLCGHHPFDAPDAASALFRILQQEPTPIQVACPECPDELAAVLNRLLSKDRETRYQTFEELLFDTAPIQRNLESRQSEELASQASALLRIGDLDTANSLVKRILIYDPANERGRKLWQHLQGEFRNRSLRLRAQALIEQSEKSAATRDFNAAIDALESAARLDPKDTAVAARISELRAAKQRCERANQMVLAARESIRVDNLSEAFRLLGDALGAEPGNPEAQQLLNDVQSKIAERDNQKRMRDSLTKAKGLLALQSFDEAIEILEELSHQSPPLDEVDASLQLARQQRQEYERKRLIQSELEEAKKEVKAKRFEAAIARLEPFARESGETSDVASLLAYVRSEWVAEQRLAKIKETAAAGWKLLKGKEFDRALAEVDAALLKFRDDQELLRLRQAITTQRAEHERAQFVQQVLSESAGREREGLLERACMALEAGLQRYPLEPSLTDALTRIRRDQVKLKERAEREQAQFVQQVLAERAELERKGQLAQACAVLEKALERYKSDATLTDALAQTRRKLELEERSRQERERSVRQVMAEFEGLEREGHLERACAALERGLETYQSDPTLVDALAQTRRKMADLEERSRQERAQFIRRVLPECAELERKGLLDQACAVLERGLEQYKSDPILADALTQIRRKMADLEEQTRKKRAESVRQVLAESAELERKGQLEQACAVLEKGLQTYKSDPSLEEALARTRRKREELEERARQERERSIKQVLAEAAELEGKGQLEQACAALEKGLQTYKSDPGLEDALVARTRRKREELEERARQERERSIRQVLDESAELESKGQLEQACAVLEKGLQTYKSDPGLEAALARIRRKREELEERARQERERSIRQVLAESAELERKGQLEQACAALEKGLQTYRSNPSLEAALARTRRKIADLEEKARQERAEFIRQVLAESADLERKGQLQNACAVLEGGLQRYEFDPIITRALAQMRQKLAEQQDQARALLEKELKQADTLILEGRALQATQLLARVQSAFPDEARITSLLDRAQAEERRRSALAALRSDAIRFLELDQPEQAREVLARGRQEFGSEPGLADLEEAAEKRCVRKAAIARARGAWQDRNFRLGAATLEGILKQDPKDAEARRLLDRILEEERAEQRRNRIENGRGEAEKMMRNLQFQDAARCLRALLEEFPEERTIRDDLGRAVDAIERQGRREAYSQGRNRADALRKTGQFKAAVTLLEELTRQFPDDAVLKEELNVASQAQIQHERRERYASGRREAAEFVAAHKLSEAIAALKALLVDFPGDSVLQEDLESARRALELQEQHERLDREVAQLEKLYRKGDAGAVKEKATALSAEFHDARINELLKWSTAELDRQSLEREREPAGALRRRRTRRNLIGSTVVAGVLAGIPIAYLLRPRPVPLKLTTDPSQLTFTLVEGVSPAPQKIRIRLDLPGGAKQVRWAATADQNWIAVNPDHGVTPSEASLSVDPHRLRAGSNSGHLLLTSEDGATSAQVSVEADAITPSTTQTHVVAPPKKEADTQIASVKRTEEAKHKEEPGDAIKKHDAEPHERQSDVQKQQVIALPPEPPRPSPKNCGAKYRLDKTGDLVWENGPKPLESGGELDFNWYEVHPGGGDLHGKLSGCPVDVIPMTDGVTIVEQPSAAYNFRRVRVRNSSSAPIGKITLRWRIIE